MLALLRPYEKNGKPRAKDVVRFKCCIVVTTLQEQAEVPGAGLSKEAFIEPATSGSLKPDYESGAVVPLSGSDQAEPPRQKGPRRVYG
jgi:hypothetical protein